MSRSDMMLVSLLLSACGLGLTACAPPQVDEDPAPRVSDNEVSDTVIELPLPAFTGDVSVEEALHQRRSVRAFRDEALGLDELAQLLWSAQGVSDEARGFRTAPSAGALYPLETYAVIGNVPDMESGVYRYDPDRNRLEPGVSGDVRRELASAALGQDFIAEAPVTIVFSGVYGRTATRYGERAERYVHIEAGHAAQNLSLQAVALGFGTVPVGAFRDDNVAAVLDLAEEETPLYILPVGRPD